TMDEVIEAAKKAEIYEDILAMPQGFDTYVGERGTLLSGGQKQRVAIARALALNPEILCFDEPTSALDPELTGEVLKVIKELKDTGSNMIVVTHEMEFARNVADKVVFMADGIIEEMGTPEEVFGNPQSPKTQAFLSKTHEGY
ncbi:MAG: amino acid ABC transporter ATP-binding protein, partial [Clostridia bacterium]|nr:amino acid ABC transporter ATP-binding protein [Clostridia bacterium]